MVEARLQRPRRKGTATAPFTPSSAIASGWLGSGLKLARRAVMASCRRTNGASRIARWKAALGVKSRPARGDAARLHLEDAQDAVGTVDDVLASDLGGEELHRHRDAEAIGVVDPVRRVQRPMHHVARLELDDLGVLVVPALVADELVARHGDALDLPRGTRRARPAGRHAGSCGRGSARAPGPGGRRGSAWRESGDDTRMPSVRDRVEKPGTPAPISAKMRSARAA